MMKTALYALVALCLLAGAARADDWPQFQQNAQRHGRLPSGPQGPYRARWIWCGPETILRNKEAKAGWKDDLTGRDGYSYPMPKSMPMTFAEGMQPVHAGGILYALDLQGNAYAIAMDDGSTKWVGKNPGGSINSPAVAGNVLICASLSGRVTALNLADGKEAWAVETGRAISGSPAVVASSIYVANHGGYVYRINAADGNVAWKVRLAGPCVGGIAADDKGCYLGSEDKFFYALSAADGSVRARTQLTGQGYRLLWPVLFKDRVLVQTVGAVCVGCEGVMDDVLKDGKDAQDESRNILRWLSGDNNGGKWRWGGPEWRHLFVFDTADLKEPYIVPAGPIEGCGTPADPPVIDNQDRVILWWRTKFPTFTAPKGGFGTSFGLDISAMDLATGLRVPIDNRKFSGQGSEADNLFALSIGGDMVYARQRFRGTHANNLKTSEHFLVEVESRRRDGGGWDSPISYIAEGDPKFQTPMPADATRVAPTVADTMIFLAEGYCITAAESAAPASK